MSLSHVHGSKPVCPCPWKSAVQHAAQSSPLCVLIKIAEVSLSITDRVAMMEGSHLHFVMGGDKGGLPLHSEDTPEFELAMKGPLPQTAPV